MPIINYKQSHLPSLVTRVVNSGSFPLHFTPYLQIYFGLLSPDFPSYTSISSIAIMSTVSQTTLSSSPAPVSFHPHSSSEIRELQAQISQMALQVQALSSQRGRSHDRGPRQKEDGKARSPSTQIMSGQTAIITGGLAVRPRNAPLHAHSKITTRETTRPATSGDKSTWL